MRAQSVQGRLSENQDLVRKAIERARERASLTPVARPVGDGYWVTALRPAVQSADTVPEPALPSSSERPSADPAGAEPSAEPARIPPEEVP